MTVTALPATAERKAAKPPGHSSALPHSTIQTLFAPPGATRSKGSPPFSKTSGWPLRHSVARQE